MSGTTFYDVILPAGGRLDSELAAKVGTDVKALIKIDGKPLLESVIDAVLGSGLVRTSVLIGGKEVREAYGSRVTYVLDEAESGPANMFNGLQRLLEQPEPPERLILATTDLPYIKAAHVKQLIEMSPADKNICVPLVRRADFEATYPGTSSTFVNLKDGEFTLGGMFLMDAQAMKRMRPHIEKVFNQRKSKLGMAKLLGLPFVIKFLTHSLSLADLEKKIISLLDCTGVAVPGAPVEFAYDIDDLEDYSYAAARSKPA